MSNPSGFHSRMWICRSPSYTKFMKKTIKIAAVKSAGLDKNHDMRNDEPATAAITMR